MAGDSNRVCNQLRDEQHLGGWYAAVRDAREPYDHFSAPDHGIHGDPAGTLILQYLPGAGRGTTAPGTAGGGTG